MPKPDLEAGVKIARGMAMRIASLRRWQRPAMVVLPLLALVLTASFAVPKLLASLKGGEVFAILKHMPLGKILAALLLTAISHGLLSVQEVLGLRALGHRVRWRTAARGAFTSYALSHNLGLAPVTGGSARLHIYTRNGVPASDVARLIVVTGCAFWAGILMIAGAAMLLLHQPLLIAGLPLGTLAARLAGAAILVTVAGLALLVMFQPAAEPNWLRRMISLRDTSVVPIMIAIAAVDLCCAAAALSALIPGIDWADPTLILVYALALVATLVTHVPGGIGVFEGVLLAGLPVHGPTLLAALLAYRVIYYVLPLAAAVSLNAVIELPRLRVSAAPVLATIRTLGLAMAPAAAGAMSFFGGALLLMSGALPAIPQRLHAIAQVLPLFFVEASHLLASLIGTALLLLAPALMARLTSGATLGRLLFLLGAAFSLAKGLDVEEAGVMLAMAAFIQLTRPAFYRRTANVFAAINRPWLVAAVLAALVSTASGLAAYNGTHIRGDMWWEFALHGDASRFLRASFASGVILCAVSLRQIISRPAAPVAPSHLASAVYQAATRWHGRSDAALALTGDKLFLIHPAGDAFVMFRPCHRTWVVMGDPVGNPARWPELLWELYRQCDRAFCRLCVYQASEALLPLMVELGLQPIKYGEEAVVEPKRFVLSGPAMKSLRNSRIRASRDGLVLRIVPSAEVGLWYERVKQLSDHWLEAKGQTEKGFSLGTAALDYLRNFDLAVVCRAIAPEEPLAFANIWVSGDGEELSIDLMRTGPDAPPGTMDFLLTGLIERAGALGCSRFCLGLAPMSGIRGGRLAPTWAKLAGLLFSAGSVGYNFRGMRHYKEKFAPRWRPLYIALPSGLGGILALLSVVELIHRRPQQASGIRFAAPAQHGKGMD